MTEPKRRLNISMLEKRLCWHRQTIWRKYKAGKFPLPHFLGQNRVWWEHEIEQWEQEETMSHGVNHETHDSPVAETTSADSYYSKSGSSPPSLTSDKGDSV